MSLMTQAMVIYRYGFRLNTPTLAALIGVKPGSLTQMICSDLPVT